MALCPDRPACTLWRNPNKTMKYKKQTKLLKHYLNKNKGKEPWGFWHTLAWIWSAFCLLICFSLAAGTRISHFSNSRLPVYACALGKPTIVPCSWNNTICAQFSIQALNFQDSYSGKEANSLNGSLSWCPVYSRQWVARNQFPLFIRLYQLWDSKLPQYWFHQQKY